MNAKCVVSLRIVERVQRNALGHDVTFNGGCRKFESGGLLQLFGSVSQHHYFVALAVLLGREPIWQLLVLECAVHHHIEAPKQRVLIQCRAKRVFSWFWLNWLLHGFYRLHWFCGLLHGFCNCRCVIQHDSAQLRQRIFNVFLIGTAFMRAVHG